MLEDHEICFHFKSDYRDHIENVINVLFRPGEPMLNGIPAPRAYLGDVFTITTIRRGSAGRGMPKKIGAKLGIPGAESIPDGAMLFMGFTSSHVHGLAQGTWPASRPSPATPTSPRTPTSPAAPRCTCRTSRSSSYNEQMQFLSRVTEETTTAYGQKLERGTVFFLRQDFGTVEGPFGFSLNDPVGARPTAGVHFIGFGPSAQHFEKMRLEMDGMEHQNRYGLPEQNLGFTSVLVTTHRQNFLLPPRAHRSTPLAEML